MGQPVRHVLHTSSTTTVFLGSSASLYSTTSPRQ